MDKECKFGDFMIVSTAHKEPVRGNYDDVDFWEAGTITGWQMLKRLILRRPIYFFRWAKIYGSQWTYVYFYKKEAASQIFDMFSFHHKLHKEERKRIAEECDGDARVKANGIDKDDTMIN